MVPFTVYDENRIFSPWNHHPTRSLLCCSRHFNRLLCESNQKIWCGILKGPDYRKWITKIRLNQFKHKHKQHMYMKQNDVPKS